MSVIAHLAPYFERYITLERVHPHATYHYKARQMFDLPVIESTLHVPKCPPDSWLYIATPVQARLAALGATDRLYVGSQTSDRMFRGDGLGGRNFHHAQMRAGNGADTLVAYLRGGGQVDIHRISAQALRCAVQDSTALRHLRPLAEQTLKHAGYWFEQYLLAEPGPGWRWNTAGAEAAALVLIRSLAVPAAAHPA